MENNGQPRFCPSCGSPIVIGKAFCSQCGTKIAFSQPETTQQPQQNVNPYAQQPQQNVNPYAQQPQQDVNPYAQQPQQNVNPYAQQPQQDVNPYAQQPQQDVNPYAQQPQQDVNPYAQQPQQDVNPYAQQPQQDVNPYAQQPQQDVNPYAQQPQQNINPYAQQPQNNNSYFPQPAQNDFNQTANPYAYSGTTETENLVQPKKRSKKPFIIAGVSVIGVAAIAVSGVIVFNMLKPSGGTLTKIGDSAKNLANANSATIDMELETNGIKADFNISYEIDKKNKEVVLVMDGSKDSSSSSYGSNETIKAIIYCKDGVHRSGFSTDGGEMTYSEIDEEALNEFFDGLNQTSTEKPDWNSLIEEAELSEYIDSKQIDAVSEALVETFENGEGKEALGITESSENGGTKYSFDIDPYKTLEVAVNTIEPLFKDKTTYNELKEQLPNYESYLNSVNLKFDISVDNAGYLSGFNFNSFGVELDLAISNIGNTKVELSNSEIESIKNAEISSSSSNIYDDYDNYDDYGSYLSDDYYTEASSYLY